MQGTVSITKTARIRSGLLDFGRSHPTGATGGIVLITIILLVLLADFVSPFRSDRTVARQLLPPMSEATIEEGTLWLGTDELGRDLVSDCCTADECPCSWESWRRSSGSRSARC